MRFSRFIGQVILLFALQISGPVSFAHAETTDWTISESPELDKEMNAIHARYTAPFMPGTIVAVLKGDKVTFLKGYGASNREFNMPWTPDTRYTFYSTTKSMTCMAMLKLADQGLLSLDDSITLVLPELPKTFQPVKIRHLLNHTSGIWQDETAVSFAGLSVWPYDQRITADEMFAITARQDKLPYKPGTNYYYNDTGLRLAARIIERVSGKSFRDAMKQMVFEPAKMQTADTKGFEPQPYPGAATTYFMDELGDQDPAKTAISSANLNMETTGDGAGVGTIKDFIAYARYLSEHKPGGKRWIGRLTETVQLRKDRVSDYRYGFVVANHRGLTIIHHAGLWGKKIIYIPKLDTWILYMRNALDYDAPGGGNDDREIALIDAYLKSDAQGKVFLSDTNPLYDRTIVEPEDQRFTSTELKLLQGVFLEPESGKLIRLASRKAKQKTVAEVTYLGSSSNLTRDVTQGRFVTYGAADNGLELSVKGAQLNLMFADWAAPRPLIRIDPAQAFSAAQIRNLPGLFRSTQFGSTIDIKRTSDKLELHIGSGLRISDRFTLNAMTNGIIEGVNADGTHITLYYDEDDTKQIRIDINAVFGLRFHRLL